MCETCEVAAQKLFLEYAHGLSEVLGQPEGDLTPRGPLARALAVLSVAQRREMRHSAVARVFVPWRREVRTIFNRSKQAAIINLFQNYRTEAGL